MKYIAWDDLREYLFPCDEKTSPAFREELSWMALTGLRVIGAITLFFPLLVLLVQLFWPQLYPRHENRIALATMAIGAIVLPLSFRPQIRSWARTLGSFVGLAVALVTTLVWSDLAARYPSSNFQNPAPLVSILMIGVICLPLKPLHTFSLGVTVSGIYLGFLVLHPMPGISQPWYFLLEMAIWVLICTTLTVVLYAQRSSAYKARQQALQSFEDLCKAQGRLLLSENSAAQVRLAAALTHELNSPVGVLGSSVNTLLLALKKQAQPSADPSRIAKVVQSIGESADQSLRRLSEVIRRLQHFTNLDRAEVSVVDIRELLLNAVELLPPQVKAKAQVSLDLESVPPLRCHPQQLNAVFSNLLKNATDSLNGRGGVRVHCGCEHGVIRIQIQDRGMGIPKDRLPQLFEPGLFVKEGRISIANWGLFNSKSIIVEHGGEISVDSTEGQGTTVTVTLPLNPST